MSSIPEATAIRLADEERCELERLARSRKTEHQLRQRSRIVLMAADGAATRAIARAVGCTIGRANKWGCAMPSSGCFSAIKRTRTLPAECRPSDRWPTRQERARKSRLRAEARIRVRIRSLRGGGMSHLLNLHLHPETIRTERFGG